MHIIKVTGKPIIKHADTCILGVNTATKRTLLFNAWPKACPHPLIWKHAWFILQWAAVSHSRGHSFLGVMKLLICFLKAKVLLPVWRLLSVNSNLSKNDMCSQDNETYVYLMVESMIRWCTQEQRLRSWGWLKLAYFFQSRFLMN